MATTSSGNAGYVAEVRGALAGLAARASSDGGAEAALARLGDVAVIDVDAPVRSATPGGRHLKAGIKRATGWYLRYLGQQISDLGAATCELGAALVERSDRLDGLQASTAAALADLQARVAELERAR